jgi:hypothetical protein
MTIEHWQAIAGVLAMLLLVTYGQSRHWKAKADTLDSERNSDGWVDEVKFWRRHFDKASAEQVDEST